MKLKRLKVLKFRNIANTEIEFELDKPTVIVGENAQGKTNLIEAIFLLAKGKSFRQIRRQDLILFEQEYAKVTGVFADGDEDLELEVFIGNPPHPAFVMKKNQVKVDMLDFLGNVALVLFQPDDLNLVYLGPELRRGLLDWFALSLDKFNVLTQKRFKKVLEQRNALLKKIGRREAKIEDLEVWDELLIADSAKIYKYRAEIIKIYNTYLKGVYREIADGDKDVQLIYKNSLKMNENEILSCVELEEKFRFELGRARENDLRREFCTVGPQRDDFEVRIEGKDALHFASRGEIRTVVLALKMIELDYLKSRGQSPILLLDDVFSELDKGRQAKLIEKTKEVQTLITSTNAYDFGGLDAEMVKMQDGRAEV